MARPLPFLTPRPPPGLVTGRPTPPREGTMRIQRTHLRHPLASVPRRSSDLTSAFDRLFDDVFQGAFGGRAAAAGPQSPRFDLTEGEAGYRLVFELPGVDPEAVELRLDDGQLHLSTVQADAPGEPEAEAEAKAEATSDEETAAEAPTERVLYRGRRGADYEVRLRLPEDVNFEAVEADHDLGLLTVTLPKLESHPKARLVPVRRR